MKLACAGLFEVRFDFNREAPAILDLMTAYRDRPMSFADACLVRMAEQNPDAAVWTLDHDFQIYRKYRHEPIPLISPF